MGRVSVGDPAMRKGLLSGRANEYMGDADRISTMNHGPAVYFSSCSCVSASLSFPERPQQRVVCFENAIRFCHPLAVLVPECCHSSTEGKEKRNPQLLVRPEYVQTMRLVA
jgi:hypothetical protein